MLWGYSTMESSVRMVTTEKPEESRVPVDSNGKMESPAPPYLRIRAKTVLSVE